MKLKNNNFVLHFSGINRKFIRKSESFEIQKFRSSKVVCVLTFKIIVEQNDSSLLGYGITTWKDKFLLIFKNSTIAAVYPSYSWKLKDPNFLRQKNVIQILSFLNLLKGTTFHRKRITKCNVCDWTLGIYFPLTPFKGH